MSHCNNLGFYVCNKYIPGSILQWIKLQLDGQMNEQTNEQTRMNKWTDKNEQKNEQTNEWINLLILFYLIYCQLFIIKWLKLK